MVLTAEALILVPVSMAAEAGEAVGSDELVAKGANENAGAAERKPIGARDPVRW